MTRHLITAISFCARPESPVVRGYAEQGTQSWSNEAKQGRDTHMKTWVAALDT